jgi:hypothetical protein
MMITTTIRRPWDGSLDHAARIPIARFPEAATHPGFKTNKNSYATNPNGRQAKEPWVITDQLSVAGSKKTNESSSPGTAARIPIARSPEAATHPGFKTNKNPNATNPTCRQAKHAWVITDQLSVAVSKQTSVLYQKLRRGQTK